MRLLLNREVSTCLGVGGTCRFCMDRNVGHEGILYMEVNITWESTMYLSEAKTKSSLVFFFCTSSSQSSPSSDFFSSLLSPLPCSSSSDSPICLTCFNRHSTQSRTALENTRTFSELRNVRNISKRDMRWQDCTTRRAENRGRQPERISERFPSTNSHKQLTI
uniref:Uncharacterized protein n=1 Tax=Cacopsylla melanoneura TaxID=428564 RepID=A0A8D8U3P4_9HEMI